MNNGVVLRHPHTYVRTKTQERIQEMGVLLNEVVDLIKNSEQVEISFEYFRAIQEQDVIPSLMKCIRHLDQIESVFDDFEEVEIEK